jgi:hypothetical protein
VAREPAPVLHGLTTGVVYAPVDFEIKRNLRDGTLFATTVTGARLILPLQGRKGDLIIKLRDPRCRGPHPEIELGKLSP